MAVNQLLNVVAPSVIKFEPNTIQIGDMLAKVGVITDYPTKVGPGWLSRLAAMPWVSMSVHHVPADPAQLIKTINRSVMEMKSRLLQSPNAEMKERAEAMIRDAETLLRRIGEESERVFYVTTVLMIMGSDADELKMRVRQVEGMVAAASMRLRSAPYSQEDGLLAAGPFRKLPGTIAGMGSNNMPAETVAAAYPFVRSGLNHGRGIVMGRDADGGLVLADRWNPPDLSLTNPNMAILGASGSGKSFATKLYLLREWVLGAKVIIIDPEREYKILADKLGGSWVNTAGGSGCINPFQIRYVPEEADEPGDDGSDIRGPLAAHIQRLETFFGLYLRDLSDLERAQLLDAIVDVYAARGITWTTDPTTVHKWPTVRDLYERLPQDSRLAILLKQAAVGVHSTLWAHDTSIDAAGDFVVLDIHDLQDAPENVRRAQYFNVLQWAWDQVREDRSEKKILIVDEAWLLIDRENPQALRFMREMAKRIRKYKGSLWVATQNVKDFLNPAIAAEGEAVLNNTAWKLLLRQQEADLDQLIAMQSLRLSGPERDLLATARRGEGLLIAGNERLRLRVEASEAERELIG